MFCAGFVILLTMNENLRAALITESLQIIDDRGNDPSHDGNHALQVLKNVEQIAKTEEEI
jgi:hypothetical protein